MRFLPVFTYSSATVHEGNEAENFKKYMRRKISKSDEAENFKK